MQQAYSGAEVFRLLRENHLPGLTAEDDRVLAATMLGHRPREISDRLYRGDRTVRATLERLEELAGMPAGVDQRSAAVLGAWFVLHVDCEKGCVSNAWRMIMEDSIYPDEASA